MMLRHVVGGMLLALLLMVAGDAHAGSPPHLVLSRPLATFAHNPYSPAVKVQAQPYPYGYFGALGNYSRWQRQFGVNRTYTQWSQR